jgi:predicted RND superfamily exporter protein/CRP-like cAMP-binding protein
VLLLVLALTTLAGAALFDVETGQVRLRVDATTESLLADGDAERAFYDGVRGRFGDDRSLVVALAFEGDVFAATNLARIQDVTAALQAIPEVRGVLSLATAQDIRAVEGDVRIAPFDLAPGDAATRERLREEVTRHPLFGGSLVSRDGRVAAFVVRFIDIDDESYSALGLDAAVTAAAEGAADGADVWITGGSHLTEESARILLGETATLPLLILAVLAAVLLFAFRSLRGVLVPLVTIAIGVTWTLGLVAASGGVLNPLTSLVPPILTTLGLSYAVHVIAAASSAARHPAIPSSRGIAAAALEEVGLSVVLTAVTTAAGFATLLLSPLPAIRDFGLLSVAGVLLTATASLTFAPAVLALLPRPRPQPQGEDDEAPGKLAERVGRFDVRNRRKIFLATAALAVLAIGGAAQIQVGSQQITKFDADAPVRRDFERINAALGGANPMFVVLESTEPRGILATDNLHAIDELQTWLRAQPEIGAATSIVDTVKLLHRAFLDDPEALTIPERTSFTSQLLFFSEGPELRQLVDRGYQTGLVRLRARVVDSTDVDALADRIDERLASLPEGLSGRVTGGSVVLARGLDQIIRGQTLSLLTGFVIIYAVLALLFLSARIGLVALLPNALPVLAYFGALGWSGALLSPGTSLIAPMVIGIAVDDTIHYFARFIREVRRTADEERATVATLAAIGRPVTVTTVALCLGFACLAASEFHTQAELGLLAAFSLAVAWLLDVTLTPALCARLEIATLWDFLSVDLGEDPTHTITLFEGMRPSQARIVALLGQLVEVPEGRRIFRAGEPGTGLYLVIDGVVRTWSPRDGETRSFHHDRGDSFGAVGFFHGSHAVDAEALSATRLLRVSGASTETLRRRYPRVAAHLFHNLNKLLAERFALQARAEVMDAGAFADPDESDLGDGIGDLREVVGTELAREFDGLGIRTGTTAALALIPLVAVAWADGQLDPEEADAILASERDAGIDAEGPVHQLLEQWLRQPPDPELLRSWQAFIRSLDARLTVEGRHRLREIVMARARGVAQAAGGVLGVGSVSRPEERVLAEVARTFDEPPL